ncbi:MAG: hypothetical protein A2W95_11135 [Bacteroidetes bacterium GWA2_40_14]|nr:MAG: hypothetical protein A2W95_11135 [Bacteroidetes bacterium GWA2_40_14]
MTNNNLRLPTHNIKQLGFSGLQAFSSRFSILVGGQECAPKTQPFHIVKRYRQKPTTVGNMMQKEKENGTTHKTAHLQTTPANPKSKFAKELFSCPRTADS